MKLKAVECEVERLLAVIAGKWKVLILRELFHGARRHAHLSKELPGISQKVLTAQLREMKKEGGGQRTRRAASRTPMQSAAGHQPKGAHRAVAGVGAGRCRAAQGLRGKAPARRILAHPVWREAAPPRVGDARAGLEELRGAEAATAGRAIRKGGLARQFFRSNFCAPSRSSVLIRSTPL